MAFRKLHFKNVQGTRASQTLQAGELAVDESTNQLFIGDGATTGGEAVTSSSSAGNVLNPVSSTPSLADLQTYNTFVVTAGSGVTIELPVPDATIDGKRWLFVANLPSGNDLIVTRQSSGSNIGVVQGTQMIEVVYIHGVGYFANSQKGI